MSIEVIYTILLVLFVYGATRIAMKKNGGYGLYIPIIITVVSGIYLFEEKLPFLKDRLIIISIVIGLALLFRKLIKQKEVYTLSN